MTPYLHGRARLTLILLLGAGIAGCGSAGGGHGGGAAVSPPVAAPPSHPSPASPARSAASPGPHTPVWLDTVKMITNEDGWALLWTSNPAGHASLEPARTTDGGRTWALTTPPTTAKVSSSQVLLDATSIDQAWIASAATDGHTTAVFGTTDGGRTWRQSAAIPGAQPVALDVAGTDGWLLESLGAAMGSNPVQLFRSTDGGLRWSAEARSALGSQPEVGGIPAGCDKSGMSFGGRGAGWITGFCNSLSGAVLESADAGQHWKPSALPLPQHACESGGCEVPAPQFAGNTTFLQVNNYPSAAHLLVSTDSGSTWKVERLPASAGPYPRTQWFSPADGITIAAGSQESVGTHSFVTTDGGTNWTAVPLSRPFGQAGASFDFVSTGTGVAWLPDSGTGGPPPAMYRTTNSGRSWASFTPSLG